MDIDNMYEKAKQELESQSDQYEQLRKRKELLDAGLDPDSVEKEELKDEIKVEELKNIPTQSNEELKNIKTDHIVPEDDYPIFINGPMKSTVSMWKKQYNHNVDGVEMGHVFAVEVQGMYFVLRTLKRGEYMYLNSLQNQNAYTREEAIAHTCCLYPVLDYKEMADLDAGIPATLAEIIMNASGFSKQYNIEVL